MLRIRQIYTFILFSVMLTSCMVMDMENAYSPEDSLSRHIVTGRVFDADNKEIEHIKVTIEWGAELDPAIKYTASDGSFTAEIPEKIQTETFEFSIRLEDIDGEENGGRFETVTDKVIYNMGPDSPTGFIIYRLNRATASENSPQS